MSRLALAAFAALGLAACNGSTTIEGPAPGKWRLTFADGRTPPQEECVPNFTFAETRKRSQNAAKTCSEVSGHWEGPVHVTHSVCTMQGLNGPTTATTDTRMTGDFNTRYVEDMTTKFDPPLAPGATELKSSITWVRIGDC